MDSPTVRRAVVALMVALTLAALAWGVRTLVEAVAIVHNILLLPTRINPGLDSPSDSIQTVILAGGIVVVLAIAGYIVFSKLRNAEDEFAEEEDEDEEEAAKE